MTDRELLREARRVIIEYAVQDGLQDPFGAHALIARIETALAAPVSTAGDDARDAAAWRLLWRSTNDPAFKLECEGAGMQLLLRSIEESVIHDAAMRAQGESK